MLLQISPDVNKSSIRHFSTGTISLKNFEQLIDASSLFIGNLLFVDYNLNSFPISSYSSKSNFPIFFRACLLAKVVDTTS